MQDKIKEFILDIENFSAGTKEQVDSFRIKYFSKRRRRSKKRRCANYFRSNENGKHFKKPM